MFARYCGTNRFINSDRLLTSKASSYELKIKNNLYSIKVDNKYLVCLAGKLFFSDKEYHVFDFVHICKFNDFFIIASGEYYLSTSGIAYNRLLCDSNKYVLTWTKTKSNAIAFTFNDDKLLLGYNKIVFGGIGYKSLCISSQTIVEWTPTKEIQLNDIFEKIIGNPKIIILSWNHRKCIEINKDAQTKLKLFGFKIYCFHIMEAIDVYNNTEDKNNIIIFLPGC